MKIQKKILASTIGLSVLALLVTSTTQAYAESSSTSNTSTSKTSTSKSSSLKSESRTSISKTSQSTASATAFVSLNEGTDKFNKDSDNARKAYLSAKTADKPTKLKELGTKLVEERVVFLNNLVKRINAAKISSEDKSKLLEMVNEQIEKLNSQKTELSSATDLTNTRTSVQKIYTDFRIYAVFAKKIHGLLKVATTRNMIKTRIDPLMDKVQVAIDRLDDTQVDTTEITNLYNDSLTQLEKAKTSLTKAEDEFNSMVAAKDYTASTQAYDKGKAAITEVKTYLGKVKTNLSSIATILSQTKSSSKSSGVSSTQ